MKYKVFKTHKAGALILLLFLVSRGLYCEAQYTDSIQTSIEGQWIETMNKKIATDFSVNNDYELFEVKTTTNKLILAPNTPTNLRLKVNYRFLSLAVKYSPGFIQGKNNEYLKGKTKSINLAAALIFKHWFAHVNYSKIKGYYLQNTSDYLSQLNNDPYIQFPDLQYQGFMVSSAYINNAKFSYKSIWSQTERQLKSAGSFMPAYNFRYYIVDDRSNANTTQKSNNFETSIGPGYAYTFVFKQNFYFSMAMLTSMGYLNSQITNRSSSGNVHFSQNNYTIRWDAKTGFGYNGKSFYSGIYTNVSGTSYNQEKTTVMNYNTRLFYHVFIGMRIHSPKIIDNFFTKIEHIIPKK